MHVWMLGLASMVAACFLACCPVCPAHAAGQEVRASDWNADTWEYCLTLMPDGEPQPLPPRIDPQGDMRLINRDYLICLLRNGKEIPLAKAMDSLSFSIVQIADIDFDGKPEFFILINFGSSGEYYVMSDISGSDDTLKRLFGPYLEPFAYEKYTRELGFLFDGLEFDRDNRSIVLSSGGINNFMTRRFAFKDGTYVLTALGHAWPHGGGFGDIRFEVRYTLDEDPAQWTRSVLRPGEHSAPRMRVLYDSELFGQHNETRWTHRPCIQARSLILCADPGAKPEMPHEIEFVLGKAVGIVPRNTWVHVLDLAIQEDEEGQPEIWCKVSCSEDAKRCAGWVPESALFYSFREEAKLANEPSTRAVEFFRPYEKYYVDESRETPEGEWLHMQTDSRGGWIPRKEVERWMR